MWRRLAREEGIFAGFSSRQRRGSHAVAEHKSSGQNHRRAFAGLRLKYLSTDLWL